MFTPVHVTAFCQGTFWKILSLAVYFTYCSIIYLIINYRLSYHSTHSGIIRLFYSYKGRLCFNILVFTSYQVYLHQIVLSLLQLPYCYCDYTFWILEFICMRTSKIMVACKEKNVTSIYIYEENSPMMPEKILHDTR